MKQYISISLLTLMCFGCGEKKQPPIAKVDTVKLADNDSSQMIQGSFVNANMTGLIPISTDDTIVNKKWLKELLNKVDTGFFQAEYPHTPNINGRRGKVKRYEIYQSGSGTVRPMTTKEYQEYKHFWDSVNYSK